MIQITSERLATICKNLAAGFSPAVASVAGGISIDQYRDWRARGREGEPAFIIFLRLTDEAEAEWRRGCDASWAAATRVKPEAAWKPIQAMNAERRAEAIHERECVRRDLMNAKLRAQVKVLELAGSSTVDPKRRLVLLQDVVDSDDGEAKQEQG